ncbi:MSC_0620 family F1-like ATPase-associated subunit [[Mycoplasma] anseris]|uniref:Uncharacterized protein n=1 Tax=[Mycoplasma] anseris TaxID=92400 RepID=A0A2Z4NDC0_9BACT|nr:hypothetical protein [[Mycoplasma] anseris]AWX69395.1 hypothetical protein DP065_01335 [[Mycoplasma] anseris]
MKKRWNNFLKLSAFSVPFLPIVVLSASNETNSTETETPKTPDPNFATFKEKAKTLSKEKMAEIIDDVVEKYTNHSINLLKGASNEDLPNLLTKSIYYSKVADFLKNNKDQIIENPGQYGWNIVFPWIISSNNTYNKGEAVFEGITYDNIAIGDPYDYVNEITGEENRITKKEDGVINTINEKGLEDKINSYFNDFKIASEDIFANNEDFPTLEETNKTSVIWNKKDNKADLEIPNGFSSWNEYLLDKFKKRTTAFDLAKNQENNEDPNKPKPKPEAKPELPPIIPTDPVEAPNFNVKIGKENIARLNPILKYNQIDSTYTHWKTALSANKENASNLYFFFDNPINTRFHYLVTDVDTDNQANIYLYDINRESNSKEYKEPILTLPQKANESNDEYYQRASQYLLGREAFSNIIKYHYLNFYKSLGLDENILLINLGNTLISSAVFNMMFDAIKIINGENFIKTRDALINKYKKDIKAPEIEKNINSSFYKEVSDLFLNALFYSQINQTNYFTYLAASYKMLYYKYFEYIRSIEPMIIDNFKKADLNIEKFELSLRSLIQNIEYFKGYSLNPKTNMLNAYYKTLDQIKFIQSQFRNLSYLTKNNELDLNNEPNLLEFKQAYEKLNLQIYQQPKTNKQVLNIFGYSLLTISILILILAITLNVIKNKTKNTSLKSKSKIAYGFAISMFIIATLLLILGGIL